MKKIIALVAGSLHTKEALVHQLDEYLDDAFEIKGYAIDHDWIENLEGELIILSSEFILSELNALGKIHDDMNIIVAKRTINNDYLDRIVAIPDGTSVLFVNELPEIVYEVIDHMKEIGISHLNYQPYYPGIEDVDVHVTVAITPGEVNLVPSFVEEVYDIGPRIMDFTTITKILNKLDLLDEKAGQFSLRYLQKTTRISKRLAESKQKILELNNHLERVIDGLSDGLVVFDTYGTISVSNENFKKIIKSNFAFHVGRNIKEVLYNHELLSFLMDKSLFNEKIFKVNHLEYAVSKMPMGDHATVAKFRSIKETISESDRLKREMIKKGYFAKYDFDDIIGHSATMDQVKNISRKLAQSSLTILIYGESGSGKELFASAIHNASPRKNGPFLAVNFSALPDDLIESELFGYEEGAFTGAKKGGKIGLFEQADGGTLFLDEIGDVSLKLQARLLRVLQEKEIMRIGGSEIKTVDVRIIAATNKPLHEQVVNREFREDLFHRLKMGYIKIPPLRERKSDIPNLINYFLAQTCQEPMVIKQEVLNKLFQYDWYGNVRELKNTLDYMVAVATGDEITLEHFPEYEFFQSHQPSERVYEPSVDMTPDLVFILKRIRFYNENGLSCGRQRLSEDTLGTSFEMTDAQMRTKLNKLAQRGYVEVFKGKKGTQITENGIGKILGYL